MRKVNFSILLILFFVFFSSDNAQKKEVKQDAIISKIKQKLDPKGSGDIKSLGRYMEQGDPTIRDDVEDWNGIKLTQYEYTDEYDSNLKAKVVMYNADSTRIANWIYYSLVDSNKSTSDANIDKVIKHIKEASGFQFPVRGVVYEDLKKKRGDKIVDGKDQISETYFFYDGVAVSHKEIDVRTYKYNTPERLKVGQNDVILNMTKADIGEVFLYGRISSTIRKDFKKFMKYKYNENIPDLDANNGKPYLKYIKREYLKAMSNTEDGKRNNIISAWVYSNL